MDKTNIKNWYTWRHHDKPTDTEFKKLKEDILEFIQTVIEMPKPELGKQFDTGLTINNTFNNLLDIIVFYEIQDNTPPKPGYTMILVGYQELLTRNFFDDNEANYEQVAEDFTKYIKKFYKNTVQKELQ